MDAVRSLRAELVLHTVDHGYGRAAAAVPVSTALVGYLGGAAFDHDRLKGLLFGLGLAATITVLVELVRRLRRRKSSGRTSIAADQLPEPSSTSPAS